MATFVLVHGAWHGSWCWARVRRALGDQGHQVFTPTLTGVGERSHLLSRDIDLQVHVDDVANLIRWEELDDVILCGHSYGGCVISGVADALPDRIAALVYLDAFLLEEGECLHDLLPGRAAGCSSASPTTWRRLARAADPGRDLQRQCAGPRLGGPAVHAAAAGHASSRSSG